jgi:predicted Zn finger-like uncharacterized protein
MTITCPGCGAQITLGEEQVRDRIQCLCSKCETRFSVTLDSGQDAMEEFHRLAKDYDESELL